MPVERGRLEPDDGVTGVGNGVGQIDGAEHLGTAERLQLGRSHADTGAPSSRRTSPESSIDSRSGCQTAPVPRTSCTKITVTGP